jgi:chemotaxis protein methyltransferase CheR
MKEIILNTAEIKAILSEIERLSGFQMSCYAMSFIKRRTELFMAKNQIDSDTEMIYRLNTTKSFIRSFLEEMIIPGTELFRDSEMWNFFAENLNALIKSEKEVKIALPHATGPEDLYSLLIILNKIESADKVTVYVSLADSNLKHLFETVKFSEKQWKASLNNIQFIKCIHNPDEIFKKKDTQVTVKLNFENNILYDSYTLFNYPYIDEFDVIICRNQMIYYTKECQLKALKMLTKALKKGKWLILGEKEKIDGTLIGNFKPVHKSISIYKRKSYI